MHVLHKDEQHVVLRLQGGHCCCCFFFLLVFVVAEDVSLTGGAASQRIRLIDEEEQVCLHCLAAYICVKALSFSFLLICAANGKFEVCFH